MKITIGQIYIGTELRKEAKLSGLRPVRFRISYKGTHRFLSTGVDMTQDDYNEYFENPKTRKHCAEIERQLEKLTFIIREIDSNGGFSYESLYAALDRGRLDSLQDLVERKRSQMEKAGKHNSARTYRDLLSSLNAFGNDKPIPLSRFKPEFVECYKRHLLGKGMSPTSVGIQLRGLKCIGTMAEQSRLIRQNPVKKVQIPVSKKRKISVSDESLRLLLSADSSILTPAKLRWLKYWRFIYYGNGLNVSDMLRLTHKNVKRSEIVFVRHKTVEYRAEEIHIPLIPELKAIIKELATGESHLFPELDGYTPGSKEETDKILEVSRYINKAMKSIRNTLNLPEKSITTYSARHAYATKMLRAGAPVAYVASAMGHSNIETTYSNYFEGYTDEERIKYNSLLTENHGPKRTGRC